MAIGADKIAVIQIGKKKLDMDDAFYRELLWRVAGVRSSTELDDYGFSLVMEELERLGFKSDFSKRNLGHRPGMASPGQVALIRGLWAEFTDGQGTDASLGHWMEKRGWPSALRFLDAHTARKAIGALKVMLKRKKPRPAA
jgi:phage gp16-like protein